MLSLFQKLNDQYKAALPFVVFCKPNSDKWIGVFQKDATLHSITDFTESGFVFVSFDSLQRVIIPVLESDVYVTETTTANFHYPKQNETIREEVSRNHFEALVAKGIQAIQNGDFKKVVLSRSEEVPLLDLNMEIVLNQLQSNYPSAFNYCFFHPEIGLWMGATPEQFLQVNGNTIKTVALAGTQLHSQYVEWQEKEQKEQQFVTDFIAEGLKEYSRDVEVSEPYTYQAGTLVHIKSDLKSELNAKGDLGKLIETLHPTPAVCGLPKESAKKFILENEGYDRRFYSGFLGELNIDFASFRKEHSDLFVNLRCMQLQSESSEATLYVGCGITIDSNPEKEYIETVNKTMTMRKVVNLQH